MRVYVIDLKRRRDRHDRIEQHVLDLGLDPVFIDAVDGASLPHLPKGTLVAAGEYGCFMSHIKVFDDFLLQSNEAFALVLEDDVVLDPVINWPSFLHQVERAMTEESLDYLQLGFITDFYKFGLQDRIRNLTHRFTIKARALKHTSNVAYLPNTSRAGTHCYAISRHFAEKTRHLNQPVWLPADGFFDRLASSSSVSNYPNMGCVNKSLAEQESRLTPRTPHDSDVTPQ